MARRFHPRSTTAEKLRIITSAVPWKLLLLIPVLIALAIPTYVYGAHIGSSVVPSIAQFFYNLSGPGPAPAPTPTPAFPTMLPQAGSILYTVQGGDSCDGILAFQMHMASAGEIFSDVKPNTVQALNAALGQDCHALQPGVVLTLPPQYPLLAFGGTVQKIDATSPQQVLPTPLINAPSLQHDAVDCSGGCLLTVQIAPQTQVRLTVQTTLAIRLGSWVWAQAMLARKAVPGFDTYPYLDPTATLDGMSLQACDFQVDNTHDDNSVSCDQLQPNSIDGDGGAWLLAVTGPGALGHWNYGLHLPANTRVLLWLNNENGDLKFHPGNAVYRYDEESHVYVKVG
ncbi:MAG TPA: hypothetical protein VKR06_03200 [Ktedonosporobacter sp.]|nr:hypothetical protein [Ktedonosporobacter sp.]